MWESEELLEVVKLLKWITVFSDAQIDEIDIGSAIYARKHGDGSAREQAASCQKVLGGFTNFVESYATRRYGADLINRGIIPFELTDREELNRAERGAYVSLPNIRERITNGKERVKAYVLKNAAQTLSLTTGALSEKERDILMAGCMIPAG